MLLPLLLCVVGLIAGSMAMDDSSACGADVDSYSFLKPGLEAQVRALTNPVVEYLHKSGKLDDEAVLERWDGTKGTIAQHAEWILAHGRTFTRAEGFRDQGTHRNITYQVHEELTAQGGGDYYFRFSGTLDLPADALIKILSSPQYLGQVDKTVVLTETIKSYKDGNTILSLWIADPGFPFLWRDGMDLTTTHRDEDGTFWQGAMSFPNELPTLEGSVRATNRYWVYRIRPVSANRCHVMLLSQTSLKGWMPKFLTNMMVGRVLADYFHSVEELGQTLIRENRL